MAEPLRSRFVWHELMSSDPKAAVAFYKEVVGWKPQPWKNDPTYTLMTTGGSLMAGIMPARDASNPRHWLSYIGTPNLDVTARQAVEFGGKVLKPAAEIPDIGRFAILEDPQGAVFVAFTSKQAPAQDMKPGLGDFSWHELITTDWQAALNFYQKLFGWEKTESMEMGPGNTYQMFGWKGNTLGGMFNKPAQMPGPPAWLPYALVPDSKKVVGIVQRLGGKVLNGPMEVPGGDWIVQIMDPQGVMFAVHSKKPAAAATPKPAARKATPKKASKPAKKSRAAKKSKPARKSAPLRRKGARAKKGAKRRR